MATATVACAGWGALLICLNAVAAEGHSQGLGKCCTLQKVKMLLEQSARYRSTLFLSDARWVNDCSQPNKLCKSAITLLYIDVTSDGCRLVIVLSCHKNLLHFTSGSAQEQFYRKALNVQLRQINELINLSNKVHILCV